jgi:pimeloyl-ACP methyl ester carboxylesterase
MMQPLVNTGYVVCLFDYEGYGASEGKADNRNVLKDAQLILDYVISNKKPDTKLLLLGFSLGGNLAVKIATDNPSKIDALIIEGAFTSHRDIAKASIPKGVKWISKLIQSPYPSKKLVKNLPVPIFIAHSLNDRVCPYAMGETLYENANQPKYFLQLSGEHGYGLIKEAEIYINELESFLNKKKKKMRLSTYNILIKTDNKNIYS